MWTILSWLASHGTTLNIGWANYDEEILRQYDRIVCDNPKQGDCDTSNYKRYVNDLGLCYRDSVQDARWVTRPCRSSALLDSFCPNPYRNTGLIVNEQHRNIVVEKYNVVGPLIIRYIDPRVRTFEIDDVQKAFEEYRDEFSCSGLANLIRGTEELYLALQTAFNQGITKFKFEKKEKR